MYRPSTQEGMPSTSSSQPSPQLQRHRKSQSTSALAVMASGQLPGRTPRMGHSAAVAVPGASSSSSTSRRNHRSDLGTVSESEHADAYSSPRRRMSVVGSDIVPPVSGTPSRQSGTGDGRAPSRSRSSRLLSTNNDAPDTINSPNQPIPSSSSSSSALTDVAGWAGEIVSLRCTPQRRLAHLLHLEKCFTRACDALATGREVKIGCRELLSLELHTKLLVLLTRHAQTLMSRSSSHTSLAPDDSTAAALVPELCISLGLLQGLCLLSEKALAACAEDWVIEMLIDLLLLLRAIPRLPTSPSGRNERPIALNVLELVSCILVDAPEHTRTFERLGGLEAITRLLKGSTVDKEVRMRGIEFLYFYLLDEESSTAADMSTRTVSQSSVASTTSATTATTVSSDDKYPPSPLSSSSRILDDSYLHVVGELDSTARLSPNAAQFIPQTPKKKPQSSLGFMTPSVGAMRRSSGSGSAGGSVSSRSTTPTPGPTGTAIQTPGRTPTLETVPPSPEVLTSARPHARGERRGSEQRGVMGVPGSAGVAGASAGKSVGLGLGLPRSATMMELAPRSRSRDSEGETGSSDGMGHGMKSREISETPNRLPRDQSLGHAVPSTPSRRSIPPSPSSRSRFLRPDSAASGASATPPMPPPPSPGPSTSVLKSNDASRPVRRSSTMLALNTKSTTSSSAPARSRTPIEPTSPVTPTTPTTSFPSGASNQARSEATTRTSETTHNNAVKPAPTPAVVTRAPRIRHSLAPSYTYSGLSSMATSTHPATPPVPSVPQGPMSSGGAGAMLPPPPPLPPRTPSRRRDGEGGGTAVPRTPGGRVGPGDTMEGQRDGEGERNEGSRAGHSHGVHLTPRREGRDERDERVPLGSAKRVVSRSRETSGVSGKEDGQSDYKVSRRGDDEGKITSDEMIGKGKDKGRGKGTKSVQEKKDLLSAWIGNVDELVASIQKVGESRLKTAGGR